MARGHIVDIGVVAGALECACRGLATVRSRIPGAYSPTASAKALAA
jgi:hypothetical protein